MAMIAGGTLRDLIEERVGILQEARPHRGATL